MPQPDLPHIERILIICGNQDAGKSTLLRAMFVDPRFGTEGKLPTAARIRTVALSRERCVHVRCTSPHEANETIEEFFTEMGRARLAASKFRRFNYACALQPYAVNAAPDAIEFCRQLRQRHRPERIRLVQIDPRQDKMPGTLLMGSEIDTLRKLEVEVLTIDGRHAPRPTARVHGLLLADFFDFT